MPDARYGTRTYSAPVLVDGKHSPSNYRAAPALPTWQFTTVDPTAGKLSFERATAPASGWHTWSRKGKVIVTGGAAAATNRVYTVFNGQQLVAALKEAGNEPKIIRVIGHIDLRWSANNTVFKAHLDNLKGKGPLATLIGACDKITCKCWGEADAESKKILAGFGATYHETAEASFLLHPKADPASLI